jgi:hypothetical protein
MVKVAPLISAPELITKEEAYPLLIKDIGLP